MSLAVLKVLAVSDPRVFAESVRQYGLEIIGKRETDPLKSQVQTESIASIASVMTDDAHFDREMSGQTRLAKELAEHHGYIVRLI